MSTRARGKDPSKPAKAVGQDELSATDKSVEQTGTFRLLQVRKYTPVPPNPQAITTARSTVVRSGRKVAAKQSKQEKTLQSSGAFRYLHDEITQLAQEAVARAAQASEPAQVALWESCADGLNDCLRTLKAIPPVQKGRQRAQGILMIIRIASQTYSSAAYGLPDEALYLLAQASRHLGRAEELLAGLDERRRVATAPKPVSAGLQGLWDAILKNPTASTRELALQFAKDEGTVRRLKRKCRGMYTGQS